MTTINTDNAVTVPSTLTPQTISDILNQIQTLQTYEQYAYQTLANPNASQTDKQNALTRIQNLSQLRTDLYASISNMPNNLQQLNDTISSNLATQWSAINAAEDQLNADKQKLDSLNDEINSKLRLTQINTYYSEKYGMRVQILQLFVAGCLGVLVIVLFSGFLPSGVTAVLIAGVVVIAGYYILYRVVDANTRDNMNYEEYNIAGN